MNPIFSEDLLSHYLPDFKLSSVTKIREITNWIRELIDELDSGKFESLKEEEIKSRFVTIFFGDILGFNYGNSNEWQLREEKKTIIDGKKSDAALGYFFVDKYKDDVKVVIEIKDAQTNLDENQKRLGNTLTPVEQAFSYASSMGGNCQWVVVSNIKEIRFYHALDKSKCQRYYLKNFYEKDALNEDKLKELLFLFHKDKFIKKGLEKSQTYKLFEHTKIIKPEADKPIHIIDKLYKSLQRFKGFGFVNPNYIATIRPFNVLDEHVWHYSNGTLFTINGEIYNLLVELSIQNKEISFSKKLQEIITKENIVEAKEKIKWVFEYLNKCLIFNIEAIKDYRHVAKKRDEERVIGFSYHHQFYFSESQGTTTNISVYNNEKCDCISCNYRDLDFNRLFIKMKAAEGNDDFFNKEYAFGNYLLSANSYKTTYNIYKKVEKQLKGKEEKGVDYFLTKMNIKLLHNLCSDYELADKGAIMSDIKSIDLDKVIYDEVEFDVDKEVKNYLLDVKENDSIDRIEEEINEILVDIEELKLLYERGGTQMGPDLLLNLSYQYHILYLHINRNFIISDIFTDYKSMVKKFFKGHVLYSMIPEKGNNLLDVFILTEAIIHINSNDLNEILKPVKTIRVENDTVEVLLERLSNYNKTVYIENKYSSTITISPLLVEYLNTYRFKYKYSKIFANLFIILSKLDITKEQFLNNRQPIINFLKVYNELNWFDLEEFAKFLINKGKLFEANDLIEILKIAINGDNYRYITFRKLIESVPQSLAIFYPDYRINDTRLIKKALFNSTSDDDDRVEYKHLVYLFNVCDENCRKILVDAFESYLDKNFNFHFYEKLLRKSNYGYETKEYFKKYSEYVNENKYKGDVSESIDLSFYNYIILVYKLNIGFGRPELKLFTELNDCESWILNPEAFDYHKFKAGWLLTFNNQFVLSRLKGNKNIALEIEKELRREFNAELAEIKYKYFCEE